MQYSRLFTQTRREAPADISLLGQQMLVRAGYIQPLETGGPLLLPLGRRLLRRLEDRLGAALHDLGALEIGPADLTPPDGSPAWMEAAAAHLRSYRQMPAAFYQFGWQAAAPRRVEGLLGARWQRTLEVHLLSPDASDQEKRAADMAGLLVGLLRELGLPLWGGEYLPGAGIEAGQAWLFPHPAGEDLLLQCEQCGYSTEVSSARYRRPAAGPEAPAPLEPVATPDTKTIAALANLLGVPEARTAKAVFLTARDTQLVFALVRGDREVNQTALCRLLGTDRLRPATDEEIRAAGAVPGYASPVGLRGVRVVVDTQIPEAPNLVAGANREGYHLRNVNYGRDFSAGEVAEIAQARPGDACPECGEPLESLRGVILADARRWGADRGLNFVDEHGQGRPALLESHRLNLCRAMGCLAEACADEKGLRLPPAAAPWPVHLVVLSGKDPVVEQTAREAVRRLEEAGLEPLIDDRSDSPGVKFNDADLIGLPLRLTVSERALKEGGIEFKRRAEPQKWLVSLDEMVEEARRSLESGEAA
ncbi:MAG TPA: YbaK/EbsC family protein [Anaerolinea sp.]|nr:YbaK/EbsC family protein [Anaerolinea sp.]